MQEVAHHDGRDGRYWIELHGEVYDVTEFVSDHPGGSILTMGAGRHGTVLFEACHPGSSLPRAQRALRRRATHLGSLVPEDQEPYGDPAFFVAVRARVDALLRQRGLKIHARSWLVTLEAVVLLVLFTAAWALRVFLPGGSILAAIAGGVLLARMGFVMHSGNHAAVSRKPGPNARVGTLMDFIGGSSLVWRTEHQVSHHGRPNVLGHDNDCQIGAPLLRFHPQLPRYWWHRIQVPGLAIGMCVGLVKWILTDFKYLLRGRATHLPIYVSRREWAKLWTFKSLWVVMHVVIPVLVLGPVMGLWTTFVMLAVGAYYMEGIFIVNHLQRDLVPQLDVHWAVQQVQGTANWSAGSHLANFISGGLNHQVEHHLFPTMSIYLYPTIAPVVRQTCEEFGLPYRDYRGFWSALWGTMGYLHALGRPEPRSALPPAPPAPISAR